ncbi:hypothetical protein [Bermanella sp. R86510]|uniref:hypothetical protein n=1 Tax=unclassified Bermanella TaxID=2627862 RepID=UPI0037CB43BE
MLATSIQNIVQDYEFWYKRRAYYQLVADAAKAEIEQNTDYPYRSWKAKEALERAESWLEHIEREIQKINDFHNTNGEYIEALCALTPDNDESSERNLDRVVEQFTSMLSAARDEPLWQTLTADGINPAPGDEEWFDLLFKREVNPEYSLNHKVSQIDRPHRDLDRLISSCVIPVEDLSTRVRFTYADSPDEPMANTYIFYWMYGEGDLKDQLATSRADMAFFRRTKSMMPLGIGLTDEHGYIVKSTQISEFNSSFQEIDLENATFEVKPGTVYGGWGVREIIEANKFDEMDLRSFHPNNSESRQAFVDDPWNQWLNTTQFEKILTSYNQIERLGPDHRSAPELTAPSRILHSFVRNAYYTEDGNSVAGTLSLSERRQFNHVSSQYFFPNREYGFFAYPVNRGNFKTNNLLSLAEGDNPVAYRGSVLPADSEDEQPDAIQLHCTLPEWDRRITAKLDALNIELDRVAELVKVHSENIERLNGMSRLTSLMQQFPFEVRDQDQVDKGNLLLDKIDKLGEAIGNEINPEEGSQYVAADDIAAVDAAAEGLADLIFHEAFLAELNGYLKHTMENRNEEGQQHPGPYMEIEPYWAHIFETLTQCIIALSKTELSDRIWQEWVEPFLEDFSNQEDVLRMVEKLGDDFSEFIGVGKQLHGLEDREDVPEPEPIANYRADLGKELRSIEQQLEASEQARLNAEPLDLAHSNPLLWALNSYKRIATPIIHRAPGAPSILQQVIDIYSDRISQKMLDSKGALFHIKFNTALFRLCGVTEFEGKILPKSFINKIAITGYVAQSPLSERGLYLKRLRRIDGILNRKLDLQLHAALDDIAAKALNNDNTLSDRIYNANKQKWYKSMMFGISIAMNIETLRGLLSGEELEDKTPYEQALSIMEASAGLIYTGNVANNFVAAMSGRSLGERLASKSGAVKAAVDNTAVTKWLGGEAAARYMAAISVLVSVHAAVRHYDEGNNEEAFMALATAMNALHVQLAYAAKSGIGRGVLTSLAGRSVAGRVVAMGLSVLAIPFVGGAALLVASIIGACIVVYDVVKAVHELSRSALNHSFQHYIGEIKKSRSLLFDKSCEDLYEETLPGEAGELLENIDDMGDEWWFEGDSYNLGHLSWRAVVPLYLQGYSVEFIKSLVKFPSGTTESTRNLGRDRSHEVHVIIDNVEDLIAYYQEVSQPDSPDETLPSGRSKYDIAEALARGEFIPEAGMSEEITINQGGQEKVLSFDHMYYRQPDSPLGTDWEFWQERSFNEFPNKYLT